LLTVGRTQNELVTQNELLSALGVISDRWKQAKTDFMNQIFSGRMNTLSLFYSMTNDGMKNAVRIYSNQEDVASQVKKGMYAKLIPAA
jgi:hypothetical protein